MEEKLKEMLSDISKYKHNKEDLLKIYIEDRLSNSFENYYKQLSLSLDYLLSKDNLRVLKNSNKVGG